MAIEDILQVTDRVTDRRYNPEGDPQAVNQMEFLRFQEQMGVGQKEVIGKLIKMFMEAPSDFTRQFGVESADAIRELMEMTTQKELEGQGKVFAPDSAEIIGQNIGYRPDQSAIGTLQTDQADESEEMMKFLQNQLLSKTEQLSRNVDQFRILSHDEAEQMGLPVDRGHTFQMNQTTGKIDIVVGLGDTEGRHRILDVEEAMEKGLPVDQGQIWEINQMTGQVNLIEMGEAEKFKSPAGEDKEEKNFLVDIMKDIIQGGMDTGSGIINAIMDEAKQLYREHTEKSADYNPEFYEKEILNETTEDYYPPRP